MTRKTQWRAWTASVWMVDQFVWMKLGRVAAGIQVVSEVAQEEEADLVVVAEAEVGEVSTEVVVGMTGVEAVTATGLTTEALGVRRGPSVVVETGPSTHTEVEEEEEEVVATEIIGRRVATTIVLVAMTAQVEDPTAMDMTVMDEQTVGRLQSISEVSVGGSNDCRIHPRWHPELNSAGSWEQS
ncbi:uncharacterized protein LOC142993917 isoform X4 [Genypterus blacodes]|uniref:uncharacterized protein LOC142993917 isoform X4 n=1 Tax=Genypterus blacodes TaxID=154954 RepID=UPI003F75E766